MAFTFEILPISEGGWATLRVRSDRPNPIDFDSGDRIEASLSFQRPGASGVLGAFQSYRKVDASTFELRGFAYDDSVAAGDGVARYAGAITVSGVSTPFDLTAPVRDSDNGEFTADLTFQRTVARNVNFNSRVDISSPDTGRVFIRQVLELGYTPIPVMAYQFFTGRIPTLEGMAYLLGDSRSPNGLFGPYYAAFNLENRYINFASNLGVYGEGAQAFAASYGPLSMHDAITAAYRTIVGVESAAAIQAIEASAGYFRAVARERIGGADLELSAKAAMVGYVMLEAQKAHAGLYAQAVEAYALDLSDGTAKGGVDLIGAYGPGTFLDFFQPVQG